MTEPVTPKLSDAPMTRFHEMAGGEIISAQGLVVCTVNVCELRTDEAQRIVSTIIAALTKEFSGGAA